jgi:hypothetical protein
MTQNVKCDCGELINIDIFNDEGFATCPNCDNDITVRVEYNFYYDDLGKLHITDNIKEIIVMNGELYE